MSAPRSFAAWLTAYEVLVDAPAAFKAERTATGRSITSAAREMGMSAYMIRKFENGGDISALDLRMILLWMAQRGHSKPTDPS